MKRIHKILISIGVVLLVIIAFALWYQARYSMDVAETLEINAATKPTKILIASQGSEFKNQLTSALIDGIIQDTVYLKVIDVTELGSISINDWDAVVIMHTWEYNEAQFDSYGFAKTAKFDDRIIVVSTSGSGEEKMLGIDAISSASVIEEIPEISQTIINKISKLINTHK